MWCTYDRLPYNIIARVFRFLDYAADNDIVALKQFDCDFGFFVWFFHSILPQSPGLVVFVHVSYVEQVGTVSVYA